MNREQLKELGLTDEQIEVVMKEHGKTINGVKQELEGVKGERDELKTQIAERDKQLETLSKTAGASEELKQQIEQLKADNKAAQEKLEAENKALRRDTALKLKIAGKVHDPDIVLGLLNKDQIVMDEAGNITGGYEEQLKSLQESKGFLFVQETEPTFKGFKPFEGAPPKEGDKGSNIGKMLAAQSKQSGADTAKAQANYFGGGNEQ